MSEFYCVSLFQSRPPSLSFLTPFIVKLRQVHSVNIIFGERHSIHFMIISMFWYIFRRSSVFLGWEFLWSVRNWFNCQPACSSPSVISYGCSIWSNLCWRSSQFCIVYFWSSVWLGEQWVSMTYLYFNHAWPVGLKKMVQCHSCLERFPYNLHTSFYFQIWTTWCSWQ